MSTTTASGWKKAHATRQMTTSKRTKSNNRLLGPVEAAMIDEMREKDASRDTLYFHPSEMAKSNWCLRSSFYKITNVDESDPQRMQLRRVNILAEGNAIHDKWQEWLRRAGVLWGNWTCLRCDHKWEALAPQECPACNTSGRIRYDEVPVFSEEHHIIGHTDGWIKDDDGDALLEIKSVGIGTIRWEAPQLYEAYASGSLSLDDLWKRIRRPLASHKRQIMLYMFLLGVKEAIVLYEWKPTQEVREFHIEYDHDVVQPLLDKAAILKEHLDDGVLPIRPQDATHKTCDFCKFCPYRTSCWDSK